MKIETAVLPNGCSTLFRPVSWRQHNVSRGSSLQNMSGLNVFTVWSSSSYSTLCCSGWLCVSSQPRMHWSHYQAYFNPIHMTDYMGYAVVKWQFAISVLSGVVLRQAMSSVFALIQTITSGKKSSKHSIALCLFVFMHTKNVVFMSMSMQLSCWGFLICRLIFVTVLMVISQVGTLFSPAGPRL